MKAICMCVCTVKLSSDTLPPWRQFDWRQCDLRPTREHTTKRDRTAGTWMNRDSQRQTGTRQ